MGDQLLVASVAFGRHMVGLMTRPYETMRRIIDRGNAWDLAFIAAFVAGYFSLASFVKTAAFRPFLLTRQFVVLFAAAVVSYGVAVGLWWLLGRAIHAGGTLKRFAIGWGYTLVPTTYWFLVTSLLYIVIPPPRTTSTKGILFSMLYLVFSATLLTWKTMLCYLALRFGMRLTLGNILFVSAVGLPALGIYSIGMYQLGIFRIPFL